MRVWNNERGFTLIELMAAVVILGIVIVPLTSLGTAALAWHTKNQQLNEGVMLAQQKLEEVKLAIEEGETFPDAEKVGTVDVKGNNYAFEITADPHQEDQQSVPELVDVKVVIKLDEREITHLSTVARKKGIQ